MSAHIITSEKIEKGACALLDIPPLTTASLAASAADRSSDCIIDKVYPGRPLVIGFNYFTQIDTYDFFGRLKKMEASIGVPFNRVFLRDSHCRWYQHGVVGLGESFLEVARHLARLIRLVRPSSVITLGQSMGGYAAVLFGLILQADRTVAFGPLSSLRSAQAIADDDLRWLPIFEELEAHPPPLLCSDPIDLAMKLPQRPVLHIVTGTNPVGLHGEANRDSIHLARYARIPEAHIHEYPQAWHEVVQWLIENGLIDRLLRQLIMDAPPLEAGSGQGSAARQAA